MIAIGLGSAIGTFFRYLLNVFTLEVGYPLGTVLENIGGSFLLGFLTAWFVVFVPKEWIKTGLGVGLCGGFTTMSTLAADSVLLYNVHPSESMIYVMTSLFGGILFALLGFVMATRLAKRRKEKRVGGVNS